MQFHGQAEVERIGPPIWSKSMQNIQSSLIARSDTLFGVCEALGEDFGISANWFRLAFAAGVIFNLEYAVAAYAGVGVLVAISRFVFPRTRAATPVEAAPGEAPAAPAQTASERILEAA
jgi:phage shock protein PspC (stress-responsive transcriptional regulator)